MSRTFKVQYNDKNNNPVVTLSCTSSLNKFKLLNEVDKANAFEAIGRWEKCLQELKDELLITRTV